MSRGASRRPWVKLWVVGWLHGSIRWQLDPGERATWADLICMAGECSQNGQICDNDGRSLPIEYIANTLNIPIELLGSTIAKCKTEGRIEDREDGIIAISNWNAYQSEYERQKKYRQKDDDNKTKYGELKNVLLTDDEKQKLIDKFGEVVFKEKIEEMSLAIGSKGYQYKSHYLAILQWDKRGQKDGTHKQDTKSIKATGIRIVS